MKTFIQLLKREFSLFWNNKVLVVLFLGAPLFYGILLGYVYSKGKVTDIPIVLIDEDQSILSNKIQQMLEDNEVVKIAKLAYDKRNIQQEIIDNNAACAILIPKKFQNEINTKKYPEITVIVNTANVLTANYASSAANLVLGTLKAGIEIETLKKKGVPGKIAMKQYEPFKTSFIKKNNRSTNYMYFLWPGVLATVLQQVLLLGLALSFASEFENNTFGYLIHKSSSTAMLILSKITPYLLMSIGIWISYIIMANWFRMPINDNIFRLSYITALFVASVSFIGILVSILIPTQLKATEVLMVVATPSFILSGFTWPLSQMPDWVQRIANTIPLTHYLKVIRTLVVENGNVSQIKSAIYSIALIGLVCAILSFLVLHYKIKKFKRKAID